ncbi:MAG: hypothetical protein ACK5KT_13070 [Dysgonomonas sp.]
MIDKIVFYVDDVDVEKLEKTFLKYAKTSKEELDIIALDKRGVSVWGATLNETMEIEVKLVKVRNKEEKRWVLSGHGSLHKFKRKENYSTFTANDAQQAISDLGKRLDISLNKIIITSIEIGVNIEVSKEPMRYINMVHLYKKRPFIYMRPLKNSPHLRGKLCQYTDYIIKFYDKTFEARHPLSVEKKTLILSNILRYEVELKSGKYSAMGFKNIKDSTFTAEHLLHIRFYSRFARILRNVFEKIVLRDLGKNHAGKSFEEIKNYIFVTSDTYDLYRSFIEEYRLDDKEGVKEYRAVKKLKKSLEKEFDLLKETENVLELKSKFAETINIVHDTRLYSK